MPGKSTCPDQVTIHHLQKGLIPDPEACELRRHIEECPACSQNWKRISDDTESDVPGARPSLPKSKTRNLMVASLMDPAGDLGSDTPPVGSRAPNPEADGPAERFFRPAEQTGEIGRLGNYRIIKLLSQGGMGMVFQAEDMNLGRKVALKVIRPEQAATPLARQRFLQEARAVAAIEHDHIVTIYQVDEDQNVPYLAMQLLQGESLAERLLREGPLPIPEILRIARQTAEGLAAAHRHGLIHRDIKPGNIFLERIPAKKEPRVKILDFGLARQVTSAQSGLTQAGLVIGTPGYMAPEQARNQSLDRRCDLFSLGCVIYQMATGEQPFKGDDPIALLVALTVDPVPPLIKVRPEVSVPLSDFVDRLLSKSPDDRPRTAEIVADALSQLEQKQTKGRLATITDTPSSPANGGPKTKPQHRSSTTPKPDLMPASGIIPAINWDEPNGKTDPIPAPSSQKQATESLTPVENSAGNPLRVLEAIQSPAEQAPAKTPPAPAPTVVESCPKCGGKVRNMSGRSWCLSCGWDSTATDEATQVVSAPAFSWRLPSWAILLLVGCVLIITVTALRRTFMPRGSWILLYWILIEGVCGIMMYFSGHFWLLSAVVQHMRESDLFKYLDPTYVWRYGFSHLPRTRGSLILGSWGATLFVSAFMVFIYNDFAFKTKAPPVPPPAVLQAIAKIDTATEDDVSIIDILSAEEFGEGAKKEDEDLNLVDLRDKDRPEDIQMFTTECFVIGYVSSKTDSDGQPIIDQLLLGTRTDDGQIHFSGAVSVGPEWDKQAAQFRRQFLPMVNPTVKLPSEYSDAILIEPNLNSTVTVNYKEQDATNKLKNVVIQTFSVGKKPGFKP